jgi:hypothetical protein
MLVYSKSQCQGFVSNLKSCSLLLTCLQLMNYHPPCTLQQLEIPLDCDSLEVECTALDPMKATVEE